MAFKTYNPLEIDKGFYPKAWFNSDQPMTLDEVLMEAEKLQNAELSNDINEYNLKTKKREQDYSEELAEGFKTKQAEKAAAGSTDPMTMDEIFDFANEIGLKHGRGEEVADREIKRIEAEAKRQKQEREENEPKVIVRSPYSDLIKIDPKTGETEVVMQAREKLGKGEKYPKTLVNSETGEIAHADDPESEAIARSQGFDLERDDKVSVREIEDMMFMRGGRNGKRSFGDSSKVLDEFESNPNKKNEDEEPKKSSAVPPRKPGESIPDYKKRVGL